MRLRHKAAENALAIVDELVARPGFNEAAA